MKKALTCVVAIGVLVGIVSAQAVPTKLVSVQDRRSEIAAAEDYPEIVAVSYDAMTGPYFAPRAYTAIAPIIREPAFEELVEPEDEYQAVDQPLYDSAVEAGDYARSEARTEREIVEVQDPPVELFIEI
ncbi:hypothetical protein [Novosphingobium sp. CECT 9465]|uniref:hypothetical protein n=1 Tax=Novosphingobium sp. CECT 9465 TaxID=2829794 RepID=UPI001E4AE6AF|nr:hypothetical protein [Novosphingobium sp. CECT 9465]